MIVVVNVFSVVGDTCNEIDVQLFPILNTSARRCVVSCAATGGRTGRTRGRTVGTWTAGHRYACGSAGSARRTGRTSNRNHSNSTGTVFRPCACAGVPWGASSWCTSFRIPGDHTSGWPTSFWRVAAAGHRRLPSASMIVGCPWSPLRPPPQPFLHRLRAATTEASSWLPCKPRRPRSRSPVHSPPWPFVCADGRQPARWSLTRPSVSLPSSSSPPRPSAGVARTSIPR